MFRIDFATNGDVICSGRLDAANAEIAQSFMDQVADSAVLDFAALDYISSAGLGVLLKTQKRLSGNGNRLKIVNVNNHIYDIFRYAGFHSIFEIEAAQAASQD